MSNSRTLRNKQGRAPGRNGMLFKPGTPNRRIISTFLTKQHGFEWNLHATKGWRRRTL